MQAALRYTAPSSPDKHLESGLTKQLLRTNKSRAMPFKARTRDTTNPYRVLLSATGSELSSHWYYSPGDAVRVVP